MTPNQCHNFSCCATCLQTFCIILLTQIKWTRLHDLKGKSRRNIFQSLAQVQQTKNKRRHATHFPMHNSKRVDGVKHVLDQVQWSVRQSCQNVNLTVHCLLGFSRIVKSLYTMLTTRVWWSHLGTFECQCGATQHPPMLEMHRGRFSRHSCTHPATRSEGPLIHWSHSSCVGTSDGLGRWLEGGQLLHGYHAMTHLGFC